MTRKPQWRVLPRGGLRGRTGIGYTYGIDRSELGRMLDGRLLYPLHLAGKEWLDMDDFERAFRQAVDWYGLDIPKDLIEQSFAEAREWRATLTW